MQFEIKEKPITWFPKYLSKFWNNSGNWMLERIHTGYGRVLYQAGNIGSLVTLKTWKIRAPILNLQYQVNRKKMGRSESINWAYLKGNGAFWNCPDCTCFVTSLFTYISKFIKADSLLRFHKYFILLMTRNNGHILWQAWIKLVKVPCTSRRYDLGVR